MLNKIFCKGTLEKQLTEKNAIMIHSLKCSALDLGGIETSNTEKCPSPSIGIQLTLVE